MESIDGCCRAAGGERRTKEIKWSLSIVDVILNDRGVALPLRRTECVPYLKIIAMWLNRPGSGLPNPAEGAIVGVVIPR